MPVLGAGFFTGIGVWLGFTGVAATIVGFVAIGATVYAATKLLAPDIPSFDSSASRGSLVNKEGSSQPVPVVYGERRIGGTRIFIASNGADNKYLHSVVALCEGPISAIKKIYLNDELAATSSDGGATWSYESKYSGFLQVIAYKGDQTTADATLVAEDVGWTNNHVGNGIAYLYVRFEFDQDVYGGGLPNVTALVEGKTVPEIGSAWNANLSYSNNPARIIYDYLVNPNYGKGIPFSLIDSTSFNATATYCDEVVTNSDASTEKRYTTNGYVNVDGRMFDTVVELLQTCRGFITASNGYELHVDKPVDTSSVYSITDNNIIGDIEYTVGSKRTLINHIRAKLNNENAEFNYQEDFKIVSSDSLIASDGVKLTREMTLPHTTSVTMIERLATEEINQSRQSGALKVTTTTQLFEVTVGDVVKFTNDTLGQTDKLYRVVNQVLTADHTIQLTLIEYDTNVYWDNNPSILLNNKDDTDH